MVVEPLVGVGLVIYSRQAHFQIRFQNYRWNSFLNFFFQNSIFFFEMETKKMYRLFVKEEANQN